ncbi:hypothetical protein Rctr71_062 [Virus Rctr71]|nr:hypothetical protein Rctr71_062 [Virus Rctr71]
MWVRIDKGCIFNLETGVGIYLVKEGNGDARVDWANSRGDMRSIVRITNPSYELTIFDAFSALLKAMRLEV